MNDLRDESPLSDPVAGAPFSRLAVRMSRFGVVMYGVAIGGIAWFFGRDSLVPSMYLFQESAGNKVALAVTGWLISTLGPIALSVCVWLMVRRLKARWLVHLIFIPAAIVICRQGGYLFFYGAGVSGVNSPEGYALLMAGAFLLLTLFVHAVAFIVEGYKLAVKGYKKVTRPANGS